MGFGIHIILVSKQYLTHEIFAYMLYMIFVRIWLAAATQSVQHQLYFDTFPSGTC